MPGAFRSLMVVVIVMLLGCNIIKDLLTWTGKEGQSHRFDLALPTRVGPNVGVTQTV